MLKSKDILLALITKNVSKHIPKILKNAMAYASYFKSYKCIIIDGHSSDGTYEICKAGLKFNLKLEKSIDNLHPSFQDLLP